MGGLLYKDFVSIGGKKWVRDLLIMTLVFIGFRIALPGNVKDTVWIATSETGQQANYIDRLFVMGYGLFLISCMGLLNKWVAMIVEGDEKNKIKNYLSSMPLARNTYVASKYIFIAIASYAFLSLLFIWGIACGAFGGKNDGLFRNVLAAIQSFIPALIGISLLTAAIELPLFLQVGKQRALLVKTAFLLVIAFVCIGFLLFGDLVWLNEHFNIEVFLEWCQAHAFGVALFQILTPVLTLILYYLSYRIASYFENKEVCNE